MRNAQHGDFPVNMTLVDACAALPPATSACTCDHLVSCCAIGRASRWTWWTALVMLHAIHCGPLASRHGISESAKRRVGAGICRRPIFHWTQDLSAVGREAV